MATIRVNKIEAARRQIETAIELLFANRDAVSVHTLAVAGGRILRDICEQKGTPHFKSMMSWIRPGMEREFLALMNRAANFFKHADRDAEEILDNVDEAVNDVMLFLACLYYEDLGYSMTPTMRVLCAWYSTIHPNLLNDDAPMKKTISSSQFDWLRQTSRKEQLKFGMEALESGYFAR